MIQELRAASFTAPGAIKEELLLVIAELEHAIVRFGETPTEAILREMTNYWARGVRLMTLAKEKKHVVALPGGAA